MNAVYVYKNINNTIKCEIENANNDKRTQGIRERREDAKVGGGGGGEGLPWNRRANVNTAGWTSGKVVWRIDEGVRRSGCYQRSDVQETDNRSRKNYSSSGKRKFAELIVCLCDIKTIIIYEW